MTPVKFTRENPFEFEGVTVWRKKNRPSVLAVRDGFECSPTFYMTSAVVHAITAMLDSEAAQAPTFTPLPIPEVGAYISATLRGGGVLEGDVSYVNAMPHHTSVVVGDEWGYINTDAEASVEPCDIIAWHPIARPLSTPQSDDRGARLAGLVDCVKESGCAVEIEGVRISPAEVTK